MYEPFAPNHYAPPKSSTPTALIVALSALAIVLVVSALLVGAIATTSDAKAEPDHRAAFLATMQAEFPTATQADADQMGGLVCKVVSEAGSAERYVTSQQDRNDNPFKTVSRLRRMTTGAVPAYCPQYLD